MNYDLDTSSSSRHVGTVSDFRVNQFSVSSVLCGIDAYRFIGPCEKQKLLTRKCMAL